MAEFLNWGQYGSLSPHLRTLGYKRWWLKLEIIFWILSLYFYRWCTKWQGCKIDLNESSIFSIFQKPTFFVNVAAWLAKLLEWWQNMPMGQNLGPKRRHRLMPHSPPTSYPLWDMLSPAQFSNWHVSRFAYLALLPRPNNIGSNW